MSARPIERRHRHELQVRLARWMEVPLASLGIIMLVLLILDLSNILAPQWERQVRNGETAIWLVFAVDFVVEFALAPSKARYLRKNWLTAISVALPAFGALRIVRAAQVLRGLSLIRMLTTLNRGSRALSRVARRGQLGYVAALTAVVTLTAAAGAYYFEHSARGASIQSFGDAVWWAMTLVTTINSGLATTTLEGRIIGFLLRLFALGVTGYLTALIAAYLLGYRETPNLPEADRAEIRLLRSEIAELRAALKRGHADNGRVEAGEPEQLLGRRQ